MSYQRVQQILKASAKRREDLHKQLLRGKLSASQYNSLVRREQQKTDKKVALRMAQFSSC